jgi:sulfite reductase (NADPH) hemoprotein beta-component
MLRIAIPYGVLSVKQLRGLAGIARDFDRGFGHFTTRQNIQFNWIKLVETPYIWIGLPVLICMQSRHQVIASVM